MSYFSPDNIEKINKISKVLGNKYNLQEENLSKCLTGIFEEIDTIVETDFISDLCDYFCPNKNLELFNNIETLFEDFCNSHKHCEECEYNKFHKIGNCPTIFTIDYLKEHKKLLEDD